MKNILISTKITLKKAMERLSESGNKTLVVVGNNNKMLGTLSDGDLRKAILKGVKINDSIETIYNHNPKYFIKGKYTISEAKKIFINTGFDLIPIIDNNKKVLDVVLWRKVFKNDKKRNGISKLKIPIVIMAGGKGTRLEPFTKILPKPLVPIQEKPIIEHIIERFNILGCKNFYLTVNYKSHILKAYFKELQPKYKIQFIEETQPLGTAGSLKFLSGKIKSSFIVTNCDIIIDENYADIHKYHQKYKFDATVVVSMKNHIIPYGTCELDNKGFLKKIIEKPEFDFLINTGFYIMNKKMIDIIPKNKLYHMTDLLSDAKKCNLKIGVYPIREEKWIDIGQWSEYHKAIEKL